MRRPSPPSLDSGRGLTAAALLLLAAIASPASAGSGDAEASAAEVQGWLDRMALAVDGLTYQGTLVFTRGRRIDALRIYHRATETGTQERLVALSGPPREVLRDNDTIRCIFPDSQSVLIDTRIAERLFPSIPPDQVANPEGRYRFSFGGIDRVAQLRAQVIDIEPRDGLRYGYRLWLEENTGMLLKSTLLDTNGEPLEQLMFTNIQIGGPIADRDLVPDVGESGFVQVDIPKTLAKAGGDAVAARWQVVDLPDGFFMAGRRSSGEESKGAMEHMVFTDGLATVSVYVEPAGDDESHPLSGAARLGAVSLYGARIEGYTVTAVGEVPAETLRQMAASVRPADLASR